MHSPANSRLTRLLTSILPVLILAGCGQGDGPVSIQNRPATPLPPIPEGFCDPINFEILCDPVDIINFNGGATTVIDNPDASGINTSERVARMQKFPDQVFGGTLLDTGAPYDFAEGEAFTVKVWATRAVPLTFKLDQQNIERILSHTGSGEWEELCFDFSGSTTATPNPGLTLIFDDGVLGQADTDAGNWTFFYDDILQVDACPGGPVLPPTYTTITFDDPALTYSLTGFGGGDDSSVVVDPDGGVNQVARLNRSDAAETFAGVTVSLGPNQAVPVIPLDTADPQMNIRVRSPAAGIPVRLKIENASDSNVSVETEAITTAGDTWENLTFDFSMQASGTAAFDPAATYNKITIFPNFGATGATAGAQTYYFDDIAVGVGSGGGGGGGGAAPGIVPDNIVFTSDQGLTPDLVAPAIENFGSGAVFDFMFAGDADFSPAIQVQSGEGYGAGVHTGFVAFNGYAAGFSSGFENFVFKVKADAANIGAFEVKFINGGDTSVVYDLTSYSGVTDLGNGWLQVTVPMSDFAATSADNSGFLLGPLGAQPAAFTYLMTDIGFTGTAGADPGITPDNVVFASDPGVMEDLAPPAIENFGSGAVFDFMFAGDADFSPAIQVQSGEGYGAGVHTGFVAFNGYAAGFSSGFENFVFKVKADAANIGAFEVKFINGGDTSVVYDLTSYSGVTDLGNGWLQVTVPMSDFAATSADNSGFLLGPLGAQPAAFTYLMTDIGFTGTAGGGGGTPPPTGPGEQTVNGDIEAGDLSGFEIFPNGGTITADNTENNTAGGSWSIHAVAGPTNNPVIKQERRAVGTVMSNQQISVSFDMKGTAADGGVISAELFSEGAGGAVVAQPLALPGAPTTDWTTYTFTPTVAADVSGGVTLQIAVICGGAATCVSDVFLDNFSIVVN